VINPCRHPRRARRMLSAIASDEWIYWCGVCGSLCRTEGRKPGRWASPLRACVKGPAGEPRAARKAWSRLARSMAAAGAVLLALVACDTAEASSATPFNFEYSARFSNVYLMRVRDTSEGVVCYVARGDNPIGHQPNLGVSCVRELAPAVAAP
jgi:hypothetical protein